MIEVREVRPQTQEFDDFCNLQSLTLNGPYAIGRISAASWARQVRAARPEGSCFWVAYASKKPVGRIGASVMKLADIPKDHTGALAPGTWGSVGFFEVDTRSVQSDQIAELLLTQATNWLKDQSCCSAVGPMNRNTWFSYRFRTDSSPEAYTWEPIHPREYINWWQKFGFKLNASYRAFHTAHLAGFVEATKGSYQKSQALGYTLRPLNHTQPFEDLHAVYQLSLDGFRDNPFYEDISFESFSKLYVPSAESKGQSAILLAISPAGHAVGFAYGLMNSGEFVLKTMAVDSSHRGVGLSNGMAHVLGQFGLENGSTGYTTAIIHSGSQSESYGRKGQILWEHTYALHDLNLT